MNTKWISIALIAAVFPAASALAAPQEGSREFSISGSGASSKDFDNTSIGLNGQMGWYVTNEVSVGVQQTANIAALQSNNNTWSASTLGYADYNFGKDAIVPFAGANLGYIYGESVKNTGSTGLQTGLKFYVNNTTFIKTQIQYEWLFSSNDNNNDGFDNGVFLYSVGVGFNF